MQKATRFAALLLVAFAVLLLLLAVVLGMRGRSQTASTPALSIAPVPKHTQVLVAARDLPAGEPLDANDLRVAEVDRMPPGSYAEPTALVGKILSSPVAADTVITANVLAHGLALELQPGERAIAVPVDELAGAGNRIVPGDYVDVFMNLRARNRDRDDDDSQNRLLLSRLRVLSYGAQDLGQAPAPQADEDGNDSSGGNARAGSIASRESGGASTASPQAARSAVLAVPVAQANRLLLAAQGGKLFLALRHPSDNGNPDETLFPRPRNVLKPRLDLSPERRDAVATPENDAYAGLDAGALAGRDGAPTPPVRDNNARAQPPRRTAPPPLEIIRGTQGGTLSPP